MGVHFIEYNHEIDTLKLLHGSIKFNKWGLYHEKCQKIHQLTFLVHILNLMVKH